MRASLLLAYMGMLTGLVLVGLLVDGLLWLAGVSVAAVLVLALVDPSRSPPPAE